MDENIENKQTSDKHISRFLSSKGVPVKSLELVFFRFIMFYQCFHQFHFGPFPKVSQFFFLRTSLCLLPRARMQEPILKHCISQ